MSDGLDKNWFQIIVAINGFRARYKAWPTKIHLPVGATDQILGEESLEKIEQKMTLIFDGGLFITEDDRGRTYNVENDGFLAGSDVDARVWLGLEAGTLPVEPDLQPRQIKVEDIPQPKPKPIAKEKKKKEKKQKVNRKQQQKLQPDPGPKQKPPKKPKRNILLTIFLWELLLVFLTSVVMLVLAALTYNGTCVSFGQAIPCTFINYMIQVISLLPYGVYIWIMQYWWAALFFVILFPTIGLMLASRKRRKQLKQINGE